MLDANDPIYHLADEVLMLQPTRILTVRGFSALPPLTVSPVLPLFFEAGGGWLLSFSAAIRNSSIGGFRSDMALRLFLNDGEELISKGNPSDPDLVFGPGAPPQRQEAFSSFDDLFGNRTDDAAHGCPILRYMYPTDVMYVQVRNASAFFTHEPTLAFNFCRDRDIKYPDLMFLG